MVTSTKINERINQSKWTKLYVLSACLQGLTIIILQATIACFNTTQVSQGFESDQVNLDPLSSSDSETIAIASDRLNRIKWENIAFIGFQCWFVGMAFDATIYQNAAEVIALAIMNLACAVLGALEVVDGKKWLKILNNIKNSYEVETITTTSIETAYYVEIALSIMVGLFGLVFVYLSYKVVKEFGWVIYKKIGADISIQRMYRTLQLFVLALKIDIFIEFLVSVFYLIQFALKDGFDSWMTYVFVVITILMLPMLYFGRMAVASESRIQMTVFILFQLAVVFQLVLIATDAMRFDNHWYTWICFVILGMVFAVVTAILGFICSRNFDKGLKPYIQRGAEKKEMLNRAEMQKERSTAWVIDED